MTRIVKITDSTGECIEIHYDDNGNIIKKNTLQQLGSGDKLSNTGTSSNNKENDCIVSWLDAPANNPESGKNSSTADQVQGSNYNRSHNIDKTVHDQHTATENYKEQYENFRKTHPTLAKNQSPASNENSSLNRYGIIVVSVLAVIILAIGISYKCHSGNDTSDPKSSTSKHASLQSQTKEAYPGQNQTKALQERTGESVIKPITTNIFKINLDQPPPPDCKVKLLNPIVILPNGDQVQPTIFKTKVDGNELTGWTVDSYPVGSRFNCSATCE